MRTCNTTAPADLRARRDAGSGENAARTALARAALALPLAAAVSLAPAGSFATDLDNYFADRNVTMVIGFGPGGGNDTWGRLVAQHIGKHLPGNPSVVAVNRPGAGSFIAANHLFNVAPKDGTEIGMIARDAAIGPITGAEGAQFDPLAFTYLGSPTTETNVCFAVAAAEVQSIDDLMTTPLLVGDPGPGTGAHMYPRALNSILGTQFAPISGYQSSSEVFLAIERGELEGFCESYSQTLETRPGWIEDGRIRILLQGGLDSHEDLSDIPLALDLAQTEEQRQLISFLYSGQAIGRPFVAPPGLEPEVAQMLQEAFAATMADPEFRDAARTANLEVDPKSGEDLRQIVSNMVDTPQDLIDRMIEILRGGN